MTVPELELRMKEWLAGEYRAVFFEVAGEVIGYALFREQPGAIYLRQLFIVPHRRRQGLGRTAMKILFKTWPDTARLTVDVLTGNQAAIQFWRAIGYADYCLTLEIMPKASPRRNAR
jgi:predicted acetyltransferase